MVTDAYMILVVAVDPFIHSILDGKVLSCHFGYRCGNFSPDLSILSRHGQYGNPMRLGLLRSQYANGCKRILDEL